MMSSLRSTCFAVVTSLKGETPLRSVSMTIAAVILFALNTSSNAQLKSSNDDAVRDAARRACVIHQETALIDELVRNCEHLARGPAFQDTQNAAWHQCARSPGLFGTVNSEKRLKWLRANQAGKNKICLEAVEEAKRNRNDPNALIVYKPSSGSAPQSSASAPQSVGISIKVTPSDLVGEWYDGGPNCMKIWRGSDDKTYRVKVWYCNAGEPDQAVTVSARYADITELADKAGKVAIRFITRESLIATFEYPPPNHGHLNKNELFKKVPTGTVR